MASERIRKGDLAVTIHRFGAYYRHHVIPDEVHPEMVDRIAAQIDRLMPWVMRLGEEDWDLPEHPSRAAGAAGGGEDARGTPPAGQETP